MEATALDLGNDGKDNHFGNGLVQAEAAFEYIVSEFDPPCGGIVEEDDSEDEEENEKDIAILLDVIDHANQDATSTVGGRICKVNQAVCSSASDCCSNRCVATTVNGTPVCRSAPTISRNRLGNGNDRKRGGSAGSQNASNGGRRTADATMPTRIRGGVTEENAEWLSSLREQGHQLL